jgi:PAS domain S-box-containing protein
MLRLSTPVALSAGRTRQRAAHARVVAERPRAQQSESVSPNDLGLGKLFVHTRDALVVGNVDTGLIALWNPAAEQLFGWSAAEAIGRPIETRIPPAIVRLHQEGVAHFRRTGRGNVLDSARPLEVPARTKAGEEMHVELSLVVLDYPPGAHDYVLAMLRDASTRRRADLRSVDAARAEAALSDAQNSLHRHHQLVQDGTVELARELEQLERSSQRLSREIPHGCAAAQRARIVEARIARVRRILDELASLAAANAHALELRPERINLVPLVSRVVTQMRMRGSTCRLNVSMPQGLTALVDPFRIEQVLRTLLEEAVRRNPRGCWVDVELRRPLVGLARIEVRDIGRPVSDALRQRLQDASSADRGIALSRQIVEQHGGTLGVEFPPDGGVCVVLTLPTQRGRVPTGVV